MISSGLQQFIENIPKAELHIHLDSISPELLLRFAKRNNVELPFSNLEQFDAWYVLKDLQDFMQKYMLMASVLQSEEDYHDVVYEIGMNMKKQNVLRCETMFTYAAAHEGRVELDVMLNGLAHGRNAVKQKFGVDLYFIAAIDRTISPKRSLSYIKDIIPYKDNVGILGIGLDCQKKDYPAAPHIPAFELARDNGFFLSAHCGEEYAAGPKCIWEIIESVKPDRIDHGNQAIRDDRLIDYLVATQIPLTLCPMSNVALQVYQDISEHPIMALQEKGVFVTLNADDTTMMKNNNNLVYNYSCLADAFKLSYGDIEVLARNSLNASYANKAEKMAYISQLDDWLSENMM